MKQLHPRLLLPVALLAVLFSSGTNIASDLSPIADVHIHYKWSQSEVTSPEQAVALLEKNNVQLAVVFGTPPEMALELESVAPQRVIPFYQPYINNLLKPSWFLNKRVPAAVRTALASGKYHGVGEIHVSDGLGPRLDSKIFNDVLSTAAEFDVPVLIHTNASSHRYMQRICTRHERTRFIWAHAGGLDANEVGKLLKACSNVWVEFSARDPFKSIGEQVADESGTLRHSWLELIQQYPDRFMLGSDPIWPITEIDSWHSADTGWDTINALYAYHNSWLNRLDSNLAEKIRFKNAKELLK